MTTQIAYKSSVHRKCVGMSPEKRLMDAAIGSTHLHVTLIGVATGVGSRTDEITDKKTEFATGVFEAFTPEGEMVRSRKGALPDIINESLVSQLKALHEAGDKSASLRVGVECYLKKTASGRGYEWEDRVIGDGPAPNDPLQDVRKMVVDHRRGTAGQIEDQTGEAEPAPVPEPAPAPAAHGKRK